MSYVYERKKSLKKICKNIKKKSEKVKT